MKNKLKKIIQLLKKILSGFIKQKRYVTPYQYNSPSIDKSPLWTKGPVKVCVIGAGKQGRAIARAAQNMEGCELSGLCDLDKERLNQAADQDNMSQDVLYQDIDQALQGKENDIVFVATNASSHCDVAKKVLAHDVKRVCIEKPVATSLSDALQIQEIAGNRFIAVNHSRRWNLDYQHILKVIQRGFLGSPVAAHVSWGPSGMGNIGVHLIDLVRMLCGDPKPAEVEAQLDKDDLADPGGHARITFDNGLVLFLNTSGHLNSFHKHIDLYFQNGSIRIDEQMSQWTLFIAGESIIHPLQDNGRNSVRAARVLAGLINLKAPLAGLNEGIIALECVLSIKAASDEKKILRVPFPLEKISVQAR